MTSPRTSPLFYLPATLRQSTCLQCQAQSQRRAASSIQASKIPKPTPFVPDPTAFLTLIGRNTSAHASKIPSWNALFTMSSQQMREAGIEPARSRRYILWWRERFRNGITGIGGDFKSVTDGIAELRLAEVPAQQGKKVPATVSRDEGFRKVVVNVPASELVLPEDPANPREKTEQKSNVLEQLAPPMRIKPEEARPLKGVKIVNGSMISGTGIEHVKGHAGVAKLKVKEGLWEQRRGHKVDGGERRKAEVRAKRRAAERKNAR